MKHEVVWCDRGWLPTYFGFCPSKRAWKKEMKRLGAAEPYPTSDGRCTTFENTKAGKLCVIVTISERIDHKDDPIGVLGLVTHEAAHVWQAIKNDIGEDRPSHEFEAYAMQNIVMEICKAYADTRGIATGLK
ncbi:hypothetical protein V5G24_20360 [Xanthobacter sp. VTT E-85241]|uniref:hypothetical protein n=1 Tax=Roseixanthobacter finlandensis TaxID=3119922 RepID=UPI0037283147